MEKHKSDLMIVIENMPSKLDSVVEQLKLIFSHSSSEITDTLGNALNNFHDSVNDTQLSLVDRTLILVVFIASVVIMYLLTPRQPPKKDDGLGKNKRKKEEDKTN